MCERERDREKVRRRERERERERERDREIMNGMLALLQIYFCPGPVKEEEAKPCKF